MLLLGDEGVSHHESGLVSPQTGGWTLLGHVGLLGCSNVLFLLSDPVCCDLQHQTLQQHRSRDTISAKDELLLLQLAAVSEAVTETARWNYLLNRNIDANKITKPNFFLILKF